MKHLLIVLFALMLTACNVTETLERTYAQSLVADSLLDRGFDVEDQILEPLTDKEAYRIIRAFENYDAFKEKWLRNPNYDDLLTTSFVGEYQFLRKEYKQVELIVATNWHSYDPLLQKRLLSLQIGFKDIDEQMQHAIKTSSKYEVYFQALQSVAIVVKLVAAGG